MGSGLLGRIVSFAADVDAERIMAKATSYKKPVMVG
jgi:hypothetical protein